MIKVTYRIWCVIMCVQREWEAAFSSFSQLIYLKDQVSKFVDGLVVRIWVFIIHVGSSNPHRVGFCNFNRNKVKYT